MFEALILFSLKPDSPTQPFAATDADLGDEALES